MNDEVRRRGELAPQGVDTPRARMLALAIMVGWLVLHIATPASYYLSDDIYDERFAWRMFSSVRVQHCSLTATETIDGTTRPIAMQSILPAPWVALLQRNRPAVIHRFLDWRCLSDARPSDVVLTHACQSVSGEALPAVHRSLRCAGHVYQESTDE